MSRKRGKRPATSSDEQSDSAITPAGSSGLSRAEIRRAETEHTTHSKRDRRRDRHGNQKEEKEAKEARSPGGVP